MNVSVRPGGSQVVPEPSLRRSAGPAAWNGRSADFSLQAIRSHFDRRVSPVGVTSSPRSDERISAVMGLLAEGEYGAEILLTRRSQTMTNHRGEISFPGGRVDEGESIVDAALRETWEEVGIHSRHVTVHTELSPLSTFVSRSYIVPVIASIDAKTDLRLSRSEVDRAFWVPLAELVREDTFVHELWTFDLSADVTERPMYFFYLDDETIWGATARMLYELLCLVHGVVS
jgi:8-oxo-dGTP pyrophosphatase MutT (NUDIX family)